MDVTWPHHHHSQRHTTPALTILDSPHSPHAGPAYDSPFSFHLLALSDLQPARTEPPPSSKTMGPNQSPRPMVTELCNNTTLLPGHHGSPSLPGTSSGLISSTSAQLRYPQDPYHQTAVTDSRLHVFHSLNCVNRYLT